MDNIIGQETTSDQIIELDNIFENIPLLRINLLKLIYEGLGVDLDSTNADLIDYENYMISCPEMLGAGFIPGMPYSIGSGKRAEVIKALGFSDNPTEAECKAAMETIKVPSLSKGELSITIHKRLTNNVYKAFELMKKSGFDAYMIAGYCFRKINNPNAKGSNLLSLHSFGCAVDINWDVNPFIKGGRPELTGDTNHKIRTYNSPAVRAMAANDFGWGGRYGDYMHFSIANGN